MGMKARSKLSPKQRSAIADGKELIRRWNGGELDNASESLQEAHEILGDLPAEENALREELEKLMEESTDILVEVYG